MCMERLGYGRCSRDQLEILNELRTLRPFNGKGYVLSNGEDDPRKLEA